MAIDPLKQRVPDPTDEIFWRRVRESYDMAVTRDQHISFELGELRCDVEAGSETTFIVISNIEPRLQPLVIPPGSMVLDPRDSQEDKEGNGNEN